MAEDTLDTVNEIYDLTGVSDSNTLNLRVIDIVLDKEVASIELIDKLVEKDKLKINNLDSVLDKYR